MGFSLGYALDIIGQAGSAVPSDFACWIIIVASYDRRPRSGPNPSRLGSEVGDTGFVVRSIEVLGARVVDSGSPPG